MGSVFFGTEHEKQSRDGILFTTNSRILQKCKCGGQVLVFLIAWFSITACYKVSVETVIYNDNEIPRRGRHYCVVVKIPLLRDFLENFIIFTETPSMCFHRHNYRCTKLPQKFHPKCVVSSLTCNLVPEALSADFVKCPQKMLVKDCLNRDLYLITEYVEQIDFQLP